MTLLALPPRRKSSSSQKTTQKFNIFQCILYQDRFSHLLYFYFIFYFPALGFLVFFYFGFLCNPAQGIELSSRIFWLSSKLQFHNTIIQGFAVVFIFSFVGLQVSVVRQLAVLCVRAVVRDIHHSLHAEICPGTSKRWRLFIPSAVSKRFYVVLYSLSIVIIYWLVCICSCTVSVSPSIDATLKP